MTENGAAIPLNQPVTETSLSGLDYVGGATAGTDEMWLRAYNGTWSGWVQATVTDQGAHVAGLAHGVMIGDTGAAATFVDHRNDSFVFSAELGGSREGDSQHPAISHDIHQGELTALAPAAEPAGFENWHFAQFQHDNTHDVLTSPSSVMHVHHGFIV